MARIVTYTMVMAGIWIMLFLGGISTGSSAMLIGLGIGVNNLTWLSFAIAAAAIFALSIVTGNIIVGLFTRQSTESSLVAGFSTVLLTTTFIDFASIISYFFTTYPAGTDGNFAAYIIFALFSVLWAGYLISVIQWWRGNDI